MLQENDVSVANPVVSGDGLPIDCDPMPGEIL